MDRFDYVRASSLQEAVTLLNEGGLKSRPLAGSTDILLQLRHDPHYCDRLVDISRVPELRLIEKREGWVHIGAAVTFNEVQNSPIVIESSTALVQACHSVGAVQIRNMGTLGGNVANAAACADSLPALICMDTVAEIATPSGREELPLSTFVTGPNRTLLPAGGLLLRLSYPIPASPSRSAFLKIGRRNAMAISRLTVAALGRVDSSGRIVEARLVTGSATPHIERLTAVEQALLGQKPSQELYLEAAVLTVAEMTRLSGTRWSSEFKIPALHALTARILSQIFDPLEER